MSHAHPTSTLSNFQLTFDNALKVYKKRTRKDLLTHPLADRLKACDLPSSILSVLQERVQELNSSRCNKEKWLDPVVNVLYAFSDTLGEDVGSVLSPAKVIFIGFSVLFSTATAVRADQDTLFQMFECIEAFFRRLDIYTEVVPNQVIVDTITAIMVEVLNFIGIATKEMKQCQMTKYIKKLMGKSDIEDTLKTLDRLTQEVARMAAAQLLKVTNTIDNRVWGIGDNVLVVDNRLAGIDERVASVDDRVEDVDDKVKAGDDNLVTVINDRKECGGVTQRAADDVDRMEPDQLRRDLRKWLSPPDPSTNHNIARNAHHKGTAIWFLEGEIYNEWKSTGSLLWIRGKPGSGKSILCSTIIEDVKTMCNAGQASMAYFYFDMQDINKQHWRDLVPSLLVQLSTQSSACCDILSRLYSGHGNGAQQPNDDALMRCLKEMLTLPDHRPIYLIFEALDECPNVFGVPAPRELVLLVVEELVDLCISSLHICVTSRPAVDIQIVLGHLTSHWVSLHDQSGQKKDIENYVRSVVYSNSEPIMRRWRKEDKELAIETLSERADGMFRWIFYQLEVLRQCLPPSVRPTLRELPETLDETYERILREIKKPNRDYVRRVLHCLVVAIQPLRVAELAEVLALEFSDAEGIPRVNPEWRWEGEEVDLLSACSSLIAIVEVGDSRVVQFSQFSVKEFLTSERLATASEEVSNYHINLEYAHSILGQACLGALLQIQDNIDGYTPEDYPLARYAAKHWTTHAQFRYVSSLLRKGMEYLFDANKPHFKVWLTLCDLDTRPNGDATFYIFAPHDKSTAAPLYYAALCGFHELAEHLIIKHPEGVNADGGYYVRPLVAALAGGHFQVAHLLRNNGADADVRDLHGRNLLHVAAFSGNFEVVRILIEYDPVNINARDGLGSTPLLRASEGRYFKDGSVLRLLLEHGADINVQDDGGWTPLNLASIRGVVEVVRLLLEYGADVEAKNNNGNTALQGAADRGHGEVVNLLREHGAR